MRSLAKLLLLPVALMAQGPDPGLPPTSLLLARIKLHMSDNLKRQPNYTCLETVERTQRPNGGRAQVVDTLRLEVALVQGKEMFAWPGAKKFEDRELRDLVATGTFGNGSFAIFARAVFMGSTPVFVPRPEETLNGQRAVRYDFRVATPLSGYTLRVDSQEAIVGYHGSFWADPDTLDARRLEVYADDIPKFFRIESAYDRVDYAPVSIGGEQFLLPSESVLEMRGRGSAYRNFMRFSSCRQYTGESVLKFTEQVTEEGTVPAPPPPVREIELPKGTSLQFALTDELDLSKLAVGDMITASLQADVKAKRQVVAPKRAIARGRITRLEVRGSFTLLGVIFSDLDWSDQHAAIKGSLERVLGIVTAGVDMRRWPVFQPEPGEGIVMLPASQKHLIRGMLFYWRTDS